MMQPVTYRILHCYKKEASLDAAYDTPDPFIVFRSSLRRAVPVSTQGGGSLNEAYGRPCPSSNKGERAYIQTDYHVRHTTRTLQ